jgi:hypothetical protein
MAQSISYEVFLFKWKIPLKLVPGIELGIETIRTLYRILCSTSRPRTQCTKIHCKIKIYFQNLVKSSKTHQSSEMHVLDIIRTTGKKDNKVWEEIMTWLRHFMQCWAGEVGFNWLYSAQ